MHNNHRFSKLNGKNGEKYTTNREMDRARDETEKKNMRNEHRIRANDKQQRSEHVTQKSKTESAPKMKY